MADSPLFHAIFLNWYGFAVCCVIGIGAGVAVSKHWQWPTVIFAGCWAVCFYVYILFATVQVGWTETVHAQERAAGDIAWLFLVAALTGPITSWFSKEFRK